MREKEIEKLANDLEEPRAVRLLAEWLAIEHDKTRLQGDEYMEAAQELYDYLLIIGFRLIPLLIEEIKKVENKPSQYHYVCWASGAVKVKDEWGITTYYYCPCFDGDFNCGHRGCKDGVIEGDKELTDVERHENWMLQKIIKRMEEK